MLSSIRLRYLLFIGFTLVAVLPVIVISLWVDKPVFEREIAAVNEKHLLMAKELANALGRYAADVEAVFRFAVLAEISDSATDKLSELLRALHIRHISITDQNGRVKRQITPSETGEPTQFPSEVMQKILISLKGDEVAFTEVIPGLEGEPTIYLVMPLPQRLLAIGLLGTDYLLELQKSISFGERGHAAIVDHRGKVLSHPRTDWISGMKDLSKVEPVQRMMAGGTGISFFYSPAVQQDMVAGYTTVPKVGWGAMVPQPMSELEQSAQLVLGTTFKIVILSVLVAALLSWWLAGYLARPVLEVTHAAQKFAAGEPETPVILGKMIPKELRSLTESFNAMVGQISSANRALQEKSTLLQTTLDHMAEGITVVTANRNLVLFNQRFADFFGLPAKLIHTPISLTKVFRLKVRASQQHKDSGEAVSAHNSREVGIQLFDVLLRQGTSFQRTEHRRPNGRVIEQRSSLLPDGGHVTSYVDITDRKRLEETLRELHEISTAQSSSLQKLLQALLKCGCRQFNLPIGVISQIWGESYHVVQAITPDNSIQPGMTFDLGQSYCRRTLTAYAGIGFAKAADNWSTHPCYPNLKLEAYLGISVMVGYKIYGTLDFFSLEPHSTRITSTDKELLKLMAQWAASEITKQQAERGLIEKEEPTQATVQFTGDAVITANAEGAIEYMNPRAEELTGWSLEEARGKPFDKVFPAANLSVLSEQPEQPEQPEQTLRSHQG